jgi:L-fuconate dehydratase
VGRGNDIVVKAIESLKPLVVGRTLGSIVRAFGIYWRRLTQDSQLRWLGPEKGATHLALAAVVNAIWDLWAKAERKPVWKLICDLSPEEIVSLIDFHYLSDALTPKEALGILKAQAPGRKAREREVVKRGYPAYTTSAGWLGYSDEKITKLVKQGLRDGWTHFKLKVGADLKDDVRRLRLVRKLIGPDRALMVDANQRWDVGEAVAWMAELAPFGLKWIEEPTSPDDVLGHAAIARAVAPIGVATGEACQNRVIFKQLLQANAISYCQPDSGRLGGPNEILAVLLLAAKFGVPVCPHAGGVGLCEMIQHASIVDFVCVSGRMDDRVLEYVDHLHEHFAEPVKIKRGRYLPPKKPGYTTEMLPASLDAYEFPQGRIWRES